MQMETRSGKWFDYLNPSPDSILIEDIAHSLAMQCRFAGHCSMFYSVAQHSVILSRWVEEKYALVALLHDATEAYVTDIPRPLKQLLPEFEDIEQTVWEAIARKFGLPPHIPKAVHSGDRRIALAEARVLLPSQGRHWIDQYWPEVLPDVVPVSAIRARSHFMTRFCELWGEGDK